MVNVLLSFTPTVATNPSDLVYAPFMGMGSAGVAALQLGRRFIGAELDGAYFVAAQQRLADCAAKTLTDQNT